MNLDRGTFFRRGASVVAALVLITSLGGRLNGESFPISLVDNRVFVGVNVDGHGPFAFLLDTGSSSVTVEKALAARLHLEAAGAGSSDGAGENTVHFDTVHLDSIALGGVALGPMDVPSLDNSRLSRSVGFQKFDGVLGADLFRKRVVTIDVTRNLLTVEKEASFHPGRDSILLPMQLDADDVPVVSGTINGLAGRFLVDTGDRSSLTLFSPFWREHHLDREVGTTVIAMTGYGVGGPIRGIVGRPQAFSLGSIKVPAPVTRLSLQKAGAFTSSDYAGSIGMGILRRFTVAFDYARKIMWLKKSAEFARPDLYDRSGAWLGFGPGPGLMVMDVATESPAARGGLESGDLVLSVNGIAALRPNLFRLRALLRDPELSQATFRLLRQGHEEKILQVRLMDLIRAPK